MSYCTNCGAENEENSKFCRNCGAPLSKKKDYTADGLKPILSYLKIGVISIVLVIAAFFVYKKWSSKASAKLELSQKEEKVVLPEQLVIKKYFYHWLGQQVKSGKITKQSVSSADAEDGGVTEYEFADVNGDGKLDGLFSVCAVNGGNDIPCTSYFVRSEKSGGYVIVELNEDYIKNLAQLKECFSDTRVTFSKLAKNRLEGSFIAYLEEDARCCPSVSGNFVVDHNSKQIVSINNEPFNAKINEFSFYKVTGTYVGKVKEYVIENDKTLTYISDICDAEITVTYEDGFLYLYEDGKKEIQCVKLSKASNGYAFDIAFLNENVKDVLHGYSNTNFNNAKYHGSLYTDNHKLSFSMMINSENLSYLYTLFGLNLSEQDLRSLGMRGIVLTYDLEK